MFNKHSHTQTLHQPHIQKSSFFHLFKKKCVSTLFLPTGKQAQFRPNFSRRAQCMSRFRSTTVRKNGRLNWCQLQKVKGLTARSLLPPPLPNELRLGMPHLGFIFFPRHCCFHFLILKSLEQGFAHSSLVSRQAHTDERYCSIFC